MVPARLEHDRPERRVALADPDPRSQLDAELPTIRDTGCGAKLADETFGGPVLISTPFGKSNAGA